MARKKRLEQLRSLPAWQRALLIILAAFLLLAVAEVATYSYLWFASVKEGLSIHLTAEQEALTLAHGDEQDLAFSLGIQNAPLCHATCSWSLRDVRTDTIIDNGTSEMRSGRDADITTTLKAPSTGRFTTPYQLQATCQNEPTYRCQRENETRTAAQTVILNVTLNEQEQEALKAFEKQYPAWLDATSQQASQLLAISNLTDPRLGDLPAQARDEYNKAVARNGRLGRALKEEDFLSAAVVTEDRVMTPTIAAYHALEDREQVLANRLRALLSTQTYAHAAIIVGTEEQAAKLQEGLARLADAANDFPSQDLELTAQNIDAYNASLPAIDLANQTYTLASTLHALELQRCDEENTTCPAAPVYPQNQTQALNQLQEACNTAHALNATPIQERCARPQPPLPPAPQATLPDRPNTPVILEHHSIQEPLCCGPTGCEACTDTIPILFVHGHSFAETASPEYSLQAFTQMALALQDDGRLYLGRVFPGDAGHGAASGIPGGVSATTTYYYDTYAEEGTLQFAIRKSEPIESYAIRLKEAVDALQAQTGAPRVIIVAHSMGGLVARRYLQVFGEQDVAGLVMIGTPNEGVSGRTGRLCPLVGGDRECEDMHAGSLFMRKLQSGQHPTIPSLTIAGVGCDGDTDGVVDAETVSVPWARNERIEGSCPSATETLHSELLHPETYPAAYRLVKSFIQSVEG